MKFKSDTLKATDLSKLARKLCKQVFQEAHGAMAIGFRMARDWERGRVLAGVLVEVLVELLDETLIKPLAEVLIGFLEF